MKPLTQTDPVAHLILDFVERIAARPRSYSEAIEAWRTSCPRLTVWQDALARGYVARRNDRSHGAFGELTPRGVALLAANGRCPHDRSH